ncbi:rhs family protein (plasmid) [Candidatus Protochlamydia naegleriophila]|uniref:Rhs family protein n=1 Tax=Candidatus Protochlamydia naegleriophila TaxID=389348 RepID=A0A0U5CSS0_9BACT|nr:RHS repeat-associated core domain-containing protein [Candidatus Protochlamydia naegleriophila]CUI18108.1 rhs family protein [Candidatus Protochlamydia naegleriophila]
MKAIYLLWVVFGMMVSLACFADDSDTRLTAECEPIATVADCVNVISGDYFEAHADIRFNDSDSWGLSRFYDSGHLVDRSFLGFGFGSNFPFEAKEPKKNNKHSDGWVEEREGCCIPYRSSKGVLSTYKIDKRILQKGYTNLSRPALKPHVNIANMEGKFKKEGWEIKSGNGSERFYGKYKITDSGNNETTSYYDLRQEILPNGNRMLFSYANMGEMHWPSRIALTDPKGEVILSELVFQYSKDLVRVSNDRGDTVAYLKSKEKRKSVTKAGTTWKTAFFLTDVHSPQHTPVKYHLADNNDSSAFCVAKVEKIDGRYLKISYNDQSKVKSLAGPLGAQGEEKIFQRFFYKKQHTQVLDAFDQLTTYHFCSNKRLTAIAYYDVKNGKQPNIGKEGAKEENFDLLKEERFSWKTEEGKEGWLTSKTIVDGAGHILQKNAYRYDDHGNCVKEIWKGNLTGRGFDVFSEKDELTSNGVESYEKRYKYSNDGFNLLLEETTPEGLTTRYAYIPRTNRLISKLVLYDGKIQERTFYEYHPYGVLIQTIEDDGSSDKDFDLTDVTIRRVKKIEADLRSRSPSFGKPLAIQESYQNHHTGGQLVNLKTVRFTYSPRGLVSCEKVYDAEDQFRYQVLTEYDEKDRLILKVDPLGQQTRYAYDHNDNKTEEELLGSGKKTVYVYDTANRMIQKKESHKNERDEEIIFNLFYTYDALNRLTSEQDAFGNVTSYTYDRLGRQTGCIKPTVLDSNGQVFSPTVKRVYNLLNQLIEETDENGHTTKTRYTVYGKPTYLEHPDGTVERFEYYSNGRLKQAWQADGTSSHYIYNPKGQVTLEEAFDAAGILLSKQSYSYKGSLLQSSIDAMGVKTSYFYDGAGRKIQDVCRDHQVTYHYDPLGRIYKVIHRGEEGQQRVEWTDYDYLDRIVLKQQLDERGIVYGKEAFCYDSQGYCTNHTIYHQDNQPASEESEFYPWGALARKKDALGQITEYTYEFSHYNALNQKVLKKTVKEPSGRHIIEVEDACHRLVQQETYHPHLIALTQFSYDGKDNLIVQREAVINKEVIEGYYTIERSYNSRDLLEKIVEKPALKTTCYQYDARGRLAAKIKSDGVLLSYRYNPLGHLIELTASDRSLSYIYHYDLQGHLLGIHDAIHNKQQKRSYDCLGRLVEENLGNQLILRYRYDPFDRIKNLIFPDGSSIHYTYNAFRLTHVERLSKDEKSLYTCQIPEYDWCGRIRSRQLPFGTVDYTYDLLGRPLSIQGPEWSQQIHRYDGSGNLLSQSIQDTDGKWSEQFGYDGLNQLISEKGVLTNDYCYDSLHNRREHNKQINEINSLNQLVKDADSDYAYDANGNLVEQTNPNALYHYDALDRLSTLVSDGQITHFIYDGLGRCLEISDQKSHRCLLYQGEQEIGSWENGELKELCVTHSESMLHPMLAIELEGKPFVPIQDHRRNLCCLLDWKGHYIESHRYSAFGLVAPTFKKAQTPWQFSGKRTVAHLVYFGHRFYSPQMGKWLNPDPSGFEDGPNLYAYVHNNPLMHFDLLGLFDLDLTDKTFLERMQALDFESFASQAEFSPTYFSGYSAQGMRQGLWNAYRSPFITASNNYDRYVDFNEGDFNKRFEGLSSQEYLSQLGLISGEALGTGVQVAAILVLTKEVAALAGASLLRAGIGATKLFWNKAITQAAAENSTTRITEIAKSQFSHLSEAFLSAKKSLGVNQEALKLARELNFTSTTMERMSRPHRYVPRHILAKAILSGKRGIDPQGSKNAIQIVEQVFINKKPYRLEIIYNESEKRILHFHYEK